MQQLGVGDPAGRHVVGVELEGHEGEDAHARHHAGGEVLGGAPQAEVEGTDVREGLEEGRFERLGGGAGVISQRRSTETVAVPLCGRIGVGPSEVLGPGPNNGFGLTSDGVEFGLFDRRGDETCLCLSNREVLASFKWGPR